MGEKVDPQGDCQSKQPQPFRRRRLIALAALGILAVLLAFGAVRLLVGERARQEITLDLGGNVKMRLVLVPAGKFMMGSPDKEENRGSDETQHEVAISKAFYMAVYEVTQEQYEAVMGKNPSEFKGATNPVETVSWEDATEFCQKLSAKTGKRVTLPTEAQWEYACRAGTTTPFHIGETISTDQANVFFESSPKGAWGEFKDWVRKLFRMKAKARGPTPVGSFPPNGFGLYDMHGNVWEWCADWYGEDYYATSPKADPQGPATGQYRVLRGGCWGSDPRYCRSARRYWGAPVGRGYFIGFRVSVDLK